MARQSSRGAALQILDREVIAAAADRVAEKYAAGVVLGPYARRVSQPTLSRLRTQSRSTLSEATLEGLRAGLLATADVATAADDREDHQLIDDLDRSIVDRDGTELQRIFRRWAERIALDLWVRPGIVTRVKGGRLERYEITDADARRIHRQYQATGHLRRHPAIAHRLEELAALGARLDSLGLGKLIEDLAGRCETDLGTIVRGKVAQARVIGPLVEHVESGLVERDWRELSDQELTHFVKAGIERERILARRSPTLGRLQGVVARMRVAERSARKKTRKPGRQPKKR